MKLDFQQMQSIALGVERMAETERGVDFFRFTEEQEALYKERSADFYKKSFASAGVQLRFRTDSRNLGLDITVSSGSSRSFFCIELFVDGKRVDTLRNFDVEQMVGDYAGKDCPLGDFSKAFSLGEGEKEVCLYLPWSTKTTVRSLTLDDGASVIPVKPRKRMLCFGDSITHGYDAVYPSNHYTAQLAKLWDAEACNKAIGGEKFFPALASARSTFQPDVITVAYGTNDWRHSTHDAFMENCGGFLKNLRETYPAARIVVLTPIWRKDLDATCEVAPFAQMGELMEKIAAQVKDIQVVRGLQFVPADPDCFGDLRLHPNDKGFCHYFENLAKQI